jgi:hypothetical protein
MPQVDLSVKVPVVDVGAADDRDRIVQYHQLALHVGRITLRWIFFQRRPTPPGEAVLM